MALADTDTGKPATSSGRKPMTRAEAARHASLVRWKKESPYAANVMERLAEIRAKRAAKGKKKGGGKGKGGKGKAAKAPKQTPEQRKQAKEQEEAANREKAYGEVGLNEDAAASLDELAQNGTADDDGGLVKLGLAEETSDGKYRLTAAGHAVRNAASKGDSAAMHEAMSRAKDKQAGVEERAKGKAEREKARAERAAAREERKKAKAGGGGKGKGKPTEKERPTGSDQREKERQQDRVAQQADRAQRNKEHAEDRARQAQERTTREKERLADRAQRQKEHQEDRAQRNKDRADREAERKKRQTTGSVKEKAKQRQEAEAEVQRILAARSRKDIDMDELQPIISDMDAVKGELMEVAGEALAEIKAGRRNNQSDQATIDQGYELAMQLCDLFESLGADTGEEEGEEEPDTSMEGMEEMKAIADNPVAYAYQECNGIQQATTALQMLAQLAASEASEQDDDTPAILSKLRQAMQILTDFIADEVGEIKVSGINQAAIDLLRSWRDGDEEEQRATWQALVEADPDTFKAIGKRDDVSTADKERATAEYGDVTFADEKNKKYPVDTPEHIRSAWNYFAKEANQAKYDASEVIAIKKRIIAAWRSTIDKAGPPSAAETKDIDEETIEILMGGAVKMADDDTVLGPAIWLDGAPDRHDLSHMRDFFTKSTDFWLDQWDRRPILWHHALDESDILSEMRKGGVSDEEVKAMQEALVYLRANPVLGTWTKATVDPIAVWLKGQLNKAHRYRSAVKDLIDKGFIKISTDSAPHLVVRERRSNGTHEVKRWPIIAGSLTVSAAEPRLFDVQAIKALYDGAGVPVPKELLEGDEVKVADDRARLIGLELDLLELELTTDTVE